MNTNNKDDPAKSLGTRGSLADQLQVVCAALLDELLRNEHVLTLCERWTTEFGYVWTPLPVAPGEGCDVTGDGRLPAILMARISGRIPNPSDDLSRRRRRLVTSWMNELQDLLERLGIASYWLALTLSRAWAMTIARLALEEMREWGVNVELCDLPIAPMVDLHFRTQQGETVEEARIRLQEMVVLARRQLGEISSLSLPLEVTFKTEPGETVPQAWSRLQEAVSQAFTQLGEWEVSSYRPSQISEIYIDTLQRYSQWFYRNRVNGESIRSIAKTEFGSDGDQRRKDIRYGIERVANLLAFGEHQ